MKKNRLILLFYIFVNSLVFSQIKIGMTSDENILEIKKINNDIVYTYVEERTGLISIMQTFYCVINGQKYGPFSNQPQIINNDSIFCVKVKIDGQEGLIYNNKLYGPYEEINDIYLSEDYSKVAIFYTDCEDDDLYFLIENDILVFSSPYEICEICYSPSNELCYAYLKDDEYECYINVGKKSYGPFTELTYLDSFYFDSNGDWYIQIDLDDEPFVLCNGKLYDKNEFEMQFHVIGYSFVKKDTDGYYYIQENIRSESFDEIDLKSINFFEKENIPAFIAKKSNDYYIVKNCTKKYGPYENLSEDRVYYNKFTNELLYVDNEKCLYKDGNLLSNALSYSHVYISDNWSTYCYKEQRYDGQYLIANEEEIGPYDEIFGIKISKNGEKVVYEAEKNGKYYIFDGIKKYGPYDYTASLTLSPQNDLAFYYLDEGFNIFYKENIYGPYKSVFTRVLKFSFSPNGEHIAAVVEKNQESFFLFVDGDLSFSLPNIFWYPIFSKKNNDILCTYTYYNDYFYLNSKKINGEIDYEFPFSEYGIVSYTEKTNNKVIKHLLIDGKDNIGSFMWDDFIYVDNGNIMYIKN